MSFRGKIFFGRWLCGNFDFTLMLAGRLTIELKAPRDVDAGFRSREAKLLSGPARFTCVVAWKTPYIRSIQMPLPGRHYCLNWNPCQKQNVDLNASLFSRSPPRARSFFGPTASLISGKNHSLMNGLHNRAVAETGDTILRRSGILRLTFDCAY